MHEVTPIDQYVCSPATPMREVMERLGLLEHLFQLVVDADGRLLGTITDGDIRRSLLKGVPITADAGSAMNTSPIVGHVGQEELNRRRFLAISGLIAFLPIVDDAGHLRQVFVSPSRRQSFGPALVMAGGRGMRLGTLTDNLPKPLVQIAGKPMIERVLSHLEAAGFSEIYISVHYLADQINEYISRRRNRSRITLLKESEPLGTAGAIAMLPMRDNLPFLVINADVMTQVDLAALCEFYDRSGSAGTLCVREHSVEVPFGVVRSMNGEIFQGIDEKPKISNFVSAGIYYLSPTFQALVAPGTRLDMPALLNMGHAHGLKISIFPVHEYWMDVGRPADLSAASVELSIASQSAKR